MSIEQINPKAPDNYCIDELCSELFDNNHELVILLWKRVSKLVDAFLKQQGKYFDVNELQSEDFNLMTVSIEKILVSAPAWQPIYQNYKKLLENFDNSKLQLWDFINQLERSLYELINRKKTVLNHFY